MERCPRCFKTYDGIMAAGVCPHCGYYEGCEQDDPRYLPIGTVLNGRYIVGGVIGVGGFGITYKVWDSKHNISKAVKEYFQQGVVNRVPGTTEVLVSAKKRLEEFEYGKQRLLNEAQIVAKFQSPSIVKIDDYFEENNTSYMVMEFLESQTLEEYILQRKKPLEPSEAIDIGIKICEALDEIHKAGVVHRDISPDNLFVDENGNVKIIDFGSARLSKEDVDDRLIMIKPGFAPPEQYERIEPEHDRQQGWVDIYALGATLYCALTCEVPAESTDRKADFDNNTDRVCYPKDINPSIPDFLNNAIMTAMAINIHERFQTAKQFEEVLKQERKIFPVEVVRRKKKRRRTAGIGGGLLIALVLFGIAGYRYVQEKEEVVLDAANISIWYSVNEENNQAKSSALEAIAADIEDNNVFEDVEVELKAIPEDDYETVLNDAFKDDIMPMIFECLDSDADYMEAAQDISGVIDRLEKESCYFIDQYSDYFVNKDQIPMGFYLPVIYLNTNVVRDYSDEMEISCVADLMKLCEGELKYKPMSLNVNLQKTYENMFDDFSSYESSLEMENGKELFLSGESAVYFSDTSDYFEVQQNLAGCYVMVPVKTDRIICRFCDCFSMSDGTEAETAAAEAILEIFMENNAQQIYFVQNNDTKTAGGQQTNSGFPIDKAAVEAYIRVRPKFEKILNDFENYTFESR